MLTNPVSVGIMPDSTKQGSSLDHRSNSTSSLSGNDENEDYMNYVVGAAVFDLNGLPKDYYTSEESHSINWVQTIFQALGLRSLLMSSLQLEGFHHAVINGSGYSAIVVKQSSRYTAMLIRRTEHNSITSALIRWVQEFEPNQLRNNDRFRAA